MAMWCPCNMTGQWLSINDHVIDFNQVNENEDLAQRRKDKEVERHKDLITKLKDEHKAQEVNHKLVLARLEAEKDIWFASTNSTKVDAIMQVQFSVPLRGHLAPLHFYPLKFSILKWKIFQNSSETNSWRKN